MKKFICLFISIFVIGQVFAGVIGEVVDITEDDNGNLRIWVNYKIDGVEVDSSYPTIDGKEVYCFRVAYWNLINMTDTQMKEYIESEIENECSRLVTEAFRVKENQKIKEENLEKITFSNVTKTEAVIDYPRKGKRYVVKTDGTKVVTDIPVVPDLGP